MTVKRPTPPVLGTCSGSYEVVPIFELSFTQKAIKHGTSATLVLTSFPPDERPPHRSGKLDQVNITLDGGDAPSWVTWEQDASGSPVRIHFAHPPFGTDLGSYNFDIGVRANFTLEGGW